MSSSHDHPLAGEENLSRPGRRLLGCAIASILLPTLYIFWGLWGLLAPPIITLGYFVFRSEWRK